MRAVTIALLSVLLAIAVTFYAAYLVQADEIPNVYCLDPITGEIQVWLGVCPDYMIKVRNR